jgi:hypothetical protein
VFHHTEEALPPATAEVFTENGCQVWLSSYTNLAVSGNAVLGVLLFAQAS